MKTISFPLVVGRNMDTSFTTEAIFAGSMSLLSLQFAWTDGTPVGRIVLQASNDPTFAWSDVAGSQVVVNGPGDVIYNLSEIGYSMVRAYYYRSGGNGKFSGLIYGTQP